MESAWFGGHPILDLGTGERARMGLSTAPLSSRPVGRRDFLDDQRRRQLQETARSPCSFEVARRRRSYLEVCSPREYPRQTSAGPTAWPMVARLVDHPVSVH